MAKRNVDPRYLEWANDLPEAVRQQAIDSFLNSKAADTVFNLHAEMTRATQERGELARRTQAAEQQIAGIQPFITWYNTNQDVLRDEIFPTIAQEVRTRRGGGNGVPVRQQPTNARADIETSIQGHQAKLNELQAMYARGGIDIDQFSEGMGMALNAIREANGQLAQLTASYGNDIQDVRAGNERLAKQQADFQADLLKQREQDHRNSQALGQDQVQFQLEATDYMFKHKDRDVSRVIEEFKTGRYTSFNHAAAAIYGDEDFQQTVDARAKDMFDKWKTEQGKVGENSGEGPMGSYPLPPRRYREIAEAPTRDTSQDQQLGANGQPLTPGGVRRYRHAMTEAQVDEKMREVLANPQINNIQTAS